MGSHAARNYWEDVGLTKLVGGFLLAPFAWFLDLQVSYASVKWACAADRREVLLLFPLGSLSLIAVATWMSWSCWKMVRAGANEEGGSLEDRSYFLAIAGLAMNAVFALLIVTSAFGRYYLSPCE
jgi:hypothetical protein